MPDHGGSQSWRPSECQRPCTPAVDVHISQFARCEYKLRVTLSFIEHAFRFLSNLAESSGDDKRWDVNRLVVPDSSGSGDFGSGSGGSGGSGGVELPQNPFQPGGRKIAHHLGKKPDKKPKKGNKTSKQGKKLRKFKFGHQH